MSEADSVQWVYRGASLFAKTYMSNGLTFKLHNIFP